MLRAIDERQLLEHLGWVRALAFQLVRNPHSAEDLTQEVCRVALESPPRAGSGPGVRAWFRSVTRLLARHTARSERNRERRESGSARSGSAPSSYEVVERNALVQRVSQAVMGLPEPYRSTVLYRYFDGLPAPKIAELMAVPDTSVRKRLSRGLQMLRSRLQQGGTTDASVRALLALPTGTAIATKATTTGILMAMLKQKAVLGLIVVASAGMAIGALDGTAPEDTGLPQDPPEVMASTVAPPAAALAETAEQPVTRTPLVPDQPWTPSPQDPPMILGYLNGEPVTLDTELLAENLAEGLEITEVVTEEIPDVLPNGYRVETHDGGARSAAGMVAQGARVGVWNEWHEDGSPSAEGSYVHGKRHGTWTFWHPDGRVRTTGEYVYGNKEGTWTEYSKTGARTSLTTYRDGKKYDAERRWYPGGGLRAETVWVADMKQGSATTWYENGQMESRGSYQDGECTGLWEYWHEDGSVDRERTGTVAASGEGRVETGRQP